jgi:hypothetical protein
MTRYHPPANKMRNVLLVATETDVSYLDVTHLPYPTSDIPAAGAA